MKIHYENWNPWHGCTRISPGCRFCYVYRQDEGHGQIEKAMIPHLTQNFRLPIHRKKDGSYKLPPNSFVFTCFTSDFLLPEADEWRKECWQMIRERSDCHFYFFTKRIDRLAQVLPPDWQDGYDNVLIGCTVENQDRADYRLPIFLALPVKHKSIIVAPMIEAVDLTHYLDSSIELVSVSGESGINVRPLRYEWVLAIREACVHKDIPFSFHQTGAYFIKDERLYHIPRKFQIAQARKAKIDYRILENELPDVYLAM